MNPIGAAVVAGIFSRGIEGDLYDSLHTRVDIMSRQGAVLNVPATGIPANAGITHDEAQPLPVFGWLEVKWVKDGVGGDGLKRHFAPVGE